MPKRRRQSSKVQQAAGLSDKTMQYLLDYEYGVELVEEAGPGDGKVKQNPSGSSVLCRLSEEAVFIRLKEG